MGIVGNNGTENQHSSKMLLGLENPIWANLTSENPCAGYFSRWIAVWWATKVIDVITDIAEYIDSEGRHMTASQFLQYFLFTLEQQHNYVYKLSGGERRKLYLCTHL